MKFMSRIDIEPRGSEYQGMFNVWQNGRMVSSTRIALREQGNTTNLAPSIHAMRDWYENHRNPHYTVTITARGKGG